MNPTACPRAFCRATGWICFSLGVIFFVAVFFAGLVAYFVLFFFFLKQAIAQLKPEGVEANFIVAACENMVSENAMRPGDILTASNGKTIEVNAPLAPFFLDLFFVPCFFLCFFPCFSSSVCSLMHKKQTFDRILISFYFILFLITGNVFFFSRFLPFSIFVLLMFFTLACALCRTHATVKVHRFFLLRPNLIIE